MNFLSFVNIHGLKPKTVPSKVPFISDLIKENNQLLVGLSETWLKHHTEAELFVDGYKLYRSDRSRSKSSKGRDSGGVACYLRNDLASSCEPILQYSDGVIEMLGLYSKVENIIIVIVYRQPDDESHGNPSKNKEFKIAMTALKEKLLQFDNLTPDIFIGGDFNLTHILLDSGMPDKDCTKDVREMFETLTNLMQEMCMKQIVRGATHKRGNTLDLILTNNEKLVHDYHSTKPLDSITDHYIVEVATSYKPNVQRYKEAKYRKRTGFDALNFFHSETNWKEIDQKIHDHPWEREFKNLSTDQMLHCFYDVTLSICEEFTPLRKAGNRGGQKSKTEKMRIKLMRRRRRINAMLQRLKSASRSQKLKDELVLIEKTLQKMYKQESEYSEQCAISNITKNSKFFFQYAKRFAKVKSDIGPLMNEKEEYVSDPKGMADMLSQQYASVFTTPRNVTPTEDIPDPSITDFDMNEDDFIDAIDELKPNAGAGPDGFPAIFLKLCKFTLARPLYIFWKKCFDEGTIPLSLKKSLITPIHKGGSKATKSNYRPVALTSHLIKIFEKIMRKNISAFMDEHNKFNTNQHGFRAGRSCVSQLLAHYDQVLELLEESLNVDVTYLDFSKAFDKVDFSIVLNKLKQHGISGKIHNWIQSFLTDREQVVVVDGGQSDPVPVVSGVPQGSVLGPLIFIILMSDIDAGILHDTIVRSFADDTRATKGVSNVADCSKFQEDLLQIYEWAESNNMEFNSLKFEIMRYGKDEVLKLCTSYISNDGSVIDVKEHIKDLGITISDDCTFHKHIAQVVETTTKLSGWILRTFKSRDPQVMLTLWRALVLPKFDYCSQVWCPLNKGDIQRLESIQWSFIRKINGMYRLNYWECLSKLNLYSLQRRRERYRIIYTWKVTEGLVPNIGDPGIQPLFSPRIGRTCFVPALRRQVSTRLQSLRLATLGVHGAKLFNCLPKQVRDISSCGVEYFKKELDKKLLQIPDEPQIPGYTAMRRRETNSILDMIDTTRD